jgi:hypothetical protein
LNQPGLNRRYATKNTLVIRSPGLERTLKGRASPLKGADAARLRRALEFLHLIENRSEPAKRASSV